MQIIKLIMLSHMFLPQADAVYECTSGMWGPQCTKPCGFCEGGPEFCHVYDGFCVNGCASGYTGTHCKDACDAGFYGQYCKDSCGLCSDVQLACDHQSGKCLAGCQPGYQMPYCTTPCATNTWGDGCSQSCQCQNATAGAQCCDHITGKCLKCGAIRKYFKVVPPTPASPTSSRLEPPHHSQASHLTVKKPECLNQQILTGEIVEYEPPSALNFPYKPILAMMTTVGTFVFGNFLWWWFMVRNPQAKEAPPVIRREKRISRVRKSQIKYKSTLTIGIPRSAAKRLSMAQQSLRFVDVESSASLEESGSSRSQVEDSEAKESRASEKIRGYNQ